VVSTSTTTGVERGAFRRRLRGQRPAAVRRASEPGIRREQRLGDAVGGMAVCLRDAQHVADDGQARGRPAL